MDKKLEEFLKNGYSSCYLKALDTAAYFQQMMGEKLLNIVRKEVKWTTFSPIKGDSGHITYDKSKCIYAWIKGTVKGKPVMIWTGVWWNQPVRNIAFAGFWEGQKYPANFQYCSQNDRISFELYEGQPFLLVPLPDFDSLSGEIKLLLEELQRQATSKRV